MSHHRASRLLVLLALLVAPLGAAHSVEAPTSGGGATLSVTPAAGFVGGQRLTLRGNIGATGRRQIHVEFNMGRPGDIWRVVPDSQARTQRSGRFVLHTRAPSMVGISYRVRSGYLATPPFVASPVRPSVDVVAIDQHGRPTASVAKGEPHALVATALPALPGRTLTFQRRVGTHAWETIGSRSSDGAGRARLDVPAPGSGQVVYRARAEDWTEGGDRVGWMPSFPLFVTVGDGAATGHQRLRPTSAPRSPMPEVGAQGRAAKSPQAVAHSIHRWGRHLFDFDWEYGESLTSRPAQGTRLRGGWFDASNGSGRVAIYNGAMNLESGPGDSHGSTWAVLRNNAQALGRWETRVGPMASSAAFRIELVPAGVTGPGCVARSITVARVDPRAGTMTIGARGRAATWSRTWKRSVSDGFDAFAVEVKKGSIRWFIDGRSVGVLKSRAAVPGVKLVPRIVMEDDGGRRSRTMVDWVRSAPLGTGLPARGGARVARGALPPCG